MPGPVPNRAEHLGRKMADHTTPLIHLHPEMRPSGTTIRIQKKDPTTGAYGKVEPHGTYETGSADKVHELLHGVKKLADPGTRIHAEVDYHPDDISRLRAQKAEQISNSGESHMMSGATRQLKINADATREVPTKAGTSFTA